MAGNKNVPSSVWNIPADLTRDSAKRINANVRGIEV